MKTFINKHRVVLGIGAAFLAIAGAGLAITIKRGGLSKLTQIFFSNTLAELDAAGKPILLLPILTADELTQKLPDPTLAARAQLEAYRKIQCWPERLQRYDNKLIPGPQAKPVFEFPADVVVKERYTEATETCPSYQVLAFVRRPFLFSAQFAPGQSWVKWARENQQATALWEEDLVKNFLADFTGFALLSRDALGLDKVATSLVENFLSDLFAAGPGFHYQHEAGRSGWVISLPKDKSDATRKALLLFARKSLQRIYKTPDNSGKIYEWLVLNRKIFVTETRDELLIGTGLGSLVSYMSIDQKLWQAHEKGDAVVSLRLDALLGNLLPLLQNQPQNTLGQLQAEFALNAGNQGLNLTQGVSSPSRITSVMSEGVPGDLFSALPEEFAFAAGLAWNMPALDILRDQGPEAFLKKADTPEAGLLLVWDIDPQNNSQIALVGLGPVPGTTAFAPQADKRSCETAAHKKLWIVATHPDLGARIQANCRTQPAGGRALIATQKLEQKAPQALLAFHPGEAIKSLYMLGGGQPQAGEAEPGTGREAERLAAKAEAMRRVTALSGRLPVVGYAGRARADGSIQWQGF